MSSSFIKEFLLCYVVNLLYNFCLFVVLSVYLFFNIFTYLCECPSVSVSFSILNLCQLLCSNGQFVLVYLICR